ncbi:MAG TPA: glycoside hydrolase family 32 protein [Acidobacteriaceae bacterium]|nr:glycoside hydrolase family 32 protein [Acidobacteriaceae bacterium]
MLNRRQLLARTAAFAATAALRIPAFAEVSASQLAADPRRPQYHLLPARNWMNDPNGPIYWRGQYHMFFQFNPHGTTGADMHWGHAISPDMVHWRHLPVALAPTPGGPDAAGCWTGSALVDGDRVAILYAAVVSAPENEATVRDGAHSLRESQCLAFSTGDLTHWTKVPQPVIPVPPPGLDVTGFRDPAPWRQGDVWYTAIGSGIRGKGGAILLYRSSDLRHWDYLHPLYQGSGNGQAAANPVDSGDMWECPDFFPLGDRHVLIHSTGGKAYWQSGILDMKAMLFHPERSGLLDNGAYYAPKTQLDALGRRILWGWIQERRPEAQYSAAGWAGVMSLPRILTLDAHNDLQTVIAPEVEKLRENEQSLRLTGNESADRGQLARLEIRDACGEIVLNFRRGSDPLTVALVSPGASAQTWLTCRWDPAHPDTIQIEDQHVSLGADNSSEIELRLYIDGSVIEAIANRHGAFTQRFYCEGSSAPPIAVQVTAGLSNLTRLSVAQMRPISPNRLTT